MLKSQNPQAFQDAADFWWVHEEQAHDALGEAASMRVQALTECVFCGETREKCECACEICEEAFSIADERGEFVLDDGKHVVAHAQCGIDYGLDIA